MPRTPSGREPATGPAAPGPVPPGGGDRPRALVVACALVLLEAALLAVAAVVGLVALVSALTGGGGAGPVLFLVLVALGAAAFLAAAARGLWAGRRWGRAPVVTAQVFLVVVALGWWGAGGGAWAVLPLGVAVVVAGAVLSPAVVSATSTTGTPPA